MTDQPDSGAPVARLHADGSPRRLAECAARNPANAEYQDGCCRFPKSCSPYPYDETPVTDADLEPRRAMTDHDTNNDTETLAEQHVIDRDGLVWRLVHDGGMATRAHYGGIVSIGLNTLERESGPLVTLAARDADVAAQAKAEALREAADAIQALHPGEVKNSVIFLRECAREFDPRGAAVAVPEPEEGP